MMSEIENKIHPIGFIGAVMELNANIGGKTKKNSPLRAMRKCGACAACGTSLHKSPCPRVYDTGYVRTPYFSTPADVRHAAALVERASRHCTHQRMKRPSLALYTTMWRTPRCTRGWRAAIIRARVVALSAENKPSQNVSP